MDILNSFFQNIKNKLSNPFFGTLIIILIIDHWKLWYSIFTFDPKRSLEDRLFFIDSYIQEEITFASFIWDITQAIFYMLAGYLIVVLTRSIVIWIEHNSMPYITGKIVNKNVVLKTEYDQVLKEREEYFDQYEEQRKQVREFSHTIDEQSEQIKNKDQELLNQSSELSNHLNSINTKELDINRLNSEVSKLKSDKSIMEDEINEKDVQLKIFDKKYTQMKSFYFSDEVKPFYNDISKFPPIIVDKVKEIKDKKLWGVFKSVGRFYNQGGTIGGESVSKMIELDLCFERERREDLTPLGLIIWHYRKVFEDHFNLN